MFKYNSKTSRKGLSASSNEVIEYEKYILNDMNPNCVIFITLRENKFMTRSLLKILWWSGPLKKFLIFANGEHVVCSQINQILYSTSQIKGVESGNKSIRLIVDGKTRKG
jgi:hypothetical protein